MSKFKKILKWSLVGILGLLLSLFAFGYWFVSLLPKPSSTELSTTTAQSLPYLSENVVSHRGKMLAVVTSTASMGASGKPTGYELTELSRAYYVFQANGFEVDIASPQGGNPPVIIDDEDMGAYDYAFLNDPVAQKKAKNTLAVATIDPNEYAGIYFVGGKGAMYDFPENKHIQSILRSHYESGKVIGAVCHGPAALVNVTLSDGSPLLSGRTVCSFTNREELFLIPDAEDIFPFLLEDQLKEQGATFQEGTMYLENVVRDKNILTGQNPWSTWTLAEAMVSELGHTPKKRTLTSEENAIQVLHSFESRGYSDAKEMITQMATDQLEMNRTLLAMHGILAAMQWKLAKSAKLIGLVNHAKAATE